MTQIKTGLLFIMAAFVCSCQNDSLFTPETDCHNISRSGEISVDTAITIPAQDSYYWVEYTKVPLHKIEGKYFVMYDDSSAEAVETALRQGTVSLCKTLGTVDAEQSARSGSDNDGTYHNNFRYITIQGDTGIEKSLLSKVYYWTPYYRMDDGDEVRVGNRFYVQLKSDDDFELLSAFAKKNAVEIVCKDECLERWYYLECTAASRLNALEMANLFQESGLFEYGCPDIYGVGKLCEINEPLFQAGYLWHLGNNPVSPIININYIESRKLISKGSPDVIVAIIDSGVYVNHRDFDETMLDGWDATTQTSPNVPGVSHGTLVAGLIGAVPNNNQDVAGVAYGCTILPISVKVKESNRVYSLLNR